MCVRKVLKGTNVAHLMAMLPVLASITDKSVKCLRTFGLPCRESRLCTSGYETAVPQLRGLVKSVER